MTALSLDEATLSPVSAASSISSVAVTNSRPSAGTTSPASTNTTSPGTTCAISTCCAAPSRRTVVTFFIVPASAARLAAALDSPRKPNNTLKMVRTTNTIVVLH